MTGFSVSAVLALFGGTVVVLLGFVPYVAWSYRRRGRFGLGHAALVAGAAVYALALWTYTLLPLPDPALVCSDPAGVQLRPGQFLRALADARAAGGSGRGVVLQVAFNVLLFVPLGMLVRHLFRRGPVVTVLAGLTVSGLIELTQLTGVWGLYDCAYRVFDVDDLAANTLGAALGFLAAPVLRLVPDQAAADVRRPQPVTGRRRVLGMVTDVLLVDLGGLLLWVGVGSVLRSTGAMSPVELADATVLQGSLQLLVAAVLLVGVPLLGHGATLGQRAVMLRPRTESGTDPSVPQRLARAATGSGGYVLLDTLGTMTGSAFLGGAAVVLLVASLVLALRGDHRGLSHLVARLRVVDTRVPPAASTPAERWAAMPELRKLWLAVAAGAGVVHLFFLALVDQAALGGQLVLWLVLAGLTAGAVAQVVLLVLNGLAMTRREGRSLGNLLALLLGVGLVAYTALTATLVLLGAPAVLLVAVGAGWVVLGYLGFVFWAFALYGLLYARRDPTPGADAVVVLGSGIFGTRVPPLLAGRLARGREVLEAELARGGDAVLVCSGGQGPGEDVPEAVAMADHLVERGLDPALVRRESASRTTEENLRLSLELLRAEGRGERVVVVTNDYHAFRAAIITAEQGLVAQVVGAPTASYFLPSAMLREFVAVLARRPWPHALVVLAVAALAALVVVAG